MSAATKLKFTPEEYQARERRAEFKSEYFRGEIFAMAGASYDHTLIKDNLAREIGNQLKNGPCRVLTSDMRVKVEAAGLYTYPDIAVVCDDPKFEDAEFDTLLNPRVIIEVLSNSTERYDRGAKFRHYRNLASFQEYLLVSQHEPVIERYVRQGDDSWVLSTFMGIDAALAFQSIPVTVSLGDVYIGLTFTPPYSSEAET
jgi:Uma2 family endonuclease